MLIYSTFIQLIMSSELYFELAGIPETLFVNLAFFSQELSLWEFFSQFEDGELDPKDLFRREIHDA